MELFDDDMELEKIKREIIEILKKCTYSDLKFKQFITESLKDDLDAKSKVKDTNHLINDMYNIINGLGEIKWVEENIQNQIRNHCKKLSLDHHKIHGKLIQSLTEKYLNINVEFYSALREKLQLLSSIVQGSQLRKILSECFKPRKEIPYDRLRYLYTNILKDKYVYTLQKIDPSCEHVVPKKLFNQQKQVASDMHNIFLAPTLINNIRDRMKFCDFETKNCSYINEKGINKKSSVSNKYTTTEFCPEPYSRGRIARACAYFFSVYPEYFPFICDVIDLSHMKDWCIKYKPSKHEHKRNYFIYQVQKNINPYVIFPKLIDHAFLDTEQIQMEKLKLETNIISNISAISTKADEIDKILEEYVNFVNDPDDQMIASILIIQMEKLKSAVSRISDSLDRE